MDEVYLIVLCSTGGLLILLLIIILCCCCSNEKRRRCTCCTCTHPGTYAGPVPNPSGQRVVLQSNAPTIQAHLVNAHPKFWQSLSLTPTLHDDEKNRPYSPDVSPDVSPIRQPLKTSFDFSLSTTYQTQNITLTAISIRNLRCTSPKVVVHVTVLEALACCPEEGEELTRKKAELARKGVELARTGSGLSRKLSETSVKGSELEDDVFVPGIDEETERGRIRYGSTDINKPINGTDNKGYTQDVEVGTNIKKSGTLESGITDVTSDSGFGHDTTTSSLGTTSHTLQQPGGSTLSPSHRSNRSKSTISANTSSRGSSLSESPGRDGGVAPTQSFSVDGTSTSDVDPSTRCHRCKRRYTLRTAAQFESRALNFRSDLTLNEAHTFKSSTGGPFWVEVTVVEKDAPGTVICRGRSEDMYRQNHAFKTFYLETVKKEQRGSVLFGLKYLPLTQKMTLSLIESKDIQLLEKVDSAADVYMKTSLLSGGSSLIRARSHGPLPSPIHDCIALWSDHSVNFDIPTEQLDKVTIVTELIVKGKQSAITQKSTAETGTGALVELRNLMSPKKVVPEIVVAADVEAMEEGRVGVVDAKAEERIIRKKVGKVVLGKEASTEDGRQQWEEAIDSSRQEVLYWHKLY